MMPLLWALLWSASPLVLSAGPEGCTIHESESPLLKSLQCLNDYESNIHCKWSEHRKTALQLWFKTQNNNEQCVRNATAEHNASTRTVHCTHQTRAFSIGIKHTVFFLEEETSTICSSPKLELLDLSQHLRARPPVNLTTQDAGDGGWTISWSSPYPPSSSSSSTLTRNITYQLSYRTHRQDSWTTRDVMNTSVKLEKQLLDPGHRYEARVRARANVGHWSHWTPVVTWHTQENAGQFPSVHCVLDGGKGVMCSWKVRRELAQLIAYRLACRRNQTAPREMCCLNPTVTSSDLGMLRYSCSLDIADPAHQLLELLPTLNARVFKAEEHICPKPPQQVKVREEGLNWKVEWTEPSTASKLKLYYQVCYYRKQDQACSPAHQLNITEGSTSLLILGSSLAPSQVYQVRVRSFVVPGDDSIYKGAPSEFTDAVEWTSHNATWSLTVLIYFSIAVFMSTVFLTLYCTIPPCQRKVTLWVESVPSPAKSKILSEMKSSTNLTLLSTESTSVCRVRQSDSVSACSSDASLWSSKESEERLFEHDEGCWSCDKLPFRDERVNSCDTSSISFSGPYILCQSPELHRKPEDFKCATQERELVDLYGEGYLRLPRGVSRSVQDLVSCSDISITNAQRQDGGAEGQRRPDTTPAPNKMDVQPGIQRHPDHASGPFNPWPEEDAVDASGYCHVPSAVLRAV